MGRVSYLCRCVVCVCDVFLNDLLSTLGFVLFFWILMPVLYYTNIWDPRNLPVSANEPYDRFGKLYSIARIITSEQQIQPRRL